MKVKAKGLVFYNNQRFREGDVFEISDEKHFSKKWMEKVEESDSSKAKVKEEEKPSAGKKKLKPSDEDVI